MLESNVERRPSRRTKIIAIALVAVLAIALGVALVVSIPRGSERSELVHLNNQREIVDTSMNLYDPLVTRFSTRYSNSFTEKSPDEVTSQVLKEEAGRLKRESQINRERLKQMKSSPALDNGDVAKAFTDFEKAYGAIIAYNDQLVVNVTGVNQSVNGACGSLHKLDVTAEDYAQQYVSTADSCLTAVETAIKKSDPETKTLLSVVEEVISKQRDTAQKVLDSEEGFDRHIATAYLALGLLDVNGPLGKATTEWESGNREKYELLVNDANASNGALEKALTDSIGSSGSESKGE